VKGTDKANLSTPGLSQNSKSKSPSPTVITHGVQNIDNEQGYPLGVVLVQDFAEYYAVKSIHTLPYIIRIRVLFTAVSVFRQNGQSGNNSRQSNGGVIVK